LEEDKSSKIRKRKTNNMKLFSIACTLLLPASVISKVILGVDLGSLYMKVALVQTNSPIEIVTNMHSKRKTEQMILFDQGTRFYGADASSLLGRKPTSTSQVMTAFLGRSHDHPDVQILAERHYPIIPSHNETRSGVCLTIDGQTFTPEELVAMVLTHAKDITVAFGVKTQPRDCVLTVPSFYTQHERRAILDAAILADLNVLALIDENTAAALHYGIDRVDEEPHNVMFYNMGANALQVSILKYHSYARKESTYSKAKNVGTFEVLAKAWDSSLGGVAFDDRIVQFMADEFNTMWNKKRNDGVIKDVRKYPRAMAKLTIMANKVKHVLSANNDFPIFIDALHDDINYQSHLSRAHFEELCHDLLLRTPKPIQTALEQANMTLADIHAFEVIGGGFRIPKIQEDVQAAIGSLEFGMHINGDESMALGAAFHGANISTAFRVRHIGMTDINPFPISATFVNLEEKASGMLKRFFGLGHKSANDSKDKDAETIWSKQATVFKANGKTGVKKTIAFSHDKDIACGLDYEDYQYLPAGTQHAIERYNITGIADFAKEMEEKGLGKPKVSMQFEISTSGIAQLVKAEASVEEIVIVQEEVPIEDEKPESENAASSEQKDGKDEKADTSSEEQPKASEEAKEGDSADATAEGAASDNKTEAPKEKKTKMVDKEKKMVHKRALSFTVYHVGSIRPYSQPIMEESKEKLQVLATKDKERMMLEEARNDYESYIYKIRNKLADEEEAIAAISTQEQRDELSRLAMEAEDWMYDEGYDADYTTYKAKYATLTEPAEKIFFRVAEVENRAKAISALNTTLKKVEELMKKWETTKPQITAEERAEVLAQVEEVRKWIEEKEAAQAAHDPTIDPLFTSAEVPLQTKAIESLVSKLNKRPKPAPKKEEEVKNNETDSKEGESNSSSSEGNADSSEGESEDKSEAEENSAPSEESDEL
jgi:hypoxia up-regulated 1